MTNPNKQLPAGWMLLHCDADQPLDRGAPQGERPHPALVNHLRRAERILLFTGPGIASCSEPEHPLSGHAASSEISHKAFMGSEEARRALWSRVLSRWDEAKTGRPGAVHKAVVHLERAGKLEAVVTHCVDGLHKRAGTSPAHLVELHGSSVELECQRCGLRDDPQRHVEYFRTYHEPPRCRCGGYLKPATLSFDQSLQSDELGRAARAAAAADLVLVLGSSLSIYPAASIPLLAAQKGIPYVIINDTPTDYDDHPMVSLRLSEPVDQLFPAAVAEVCSGEALAC